jgi:hypothetical protein
MSNQSLYFTTIISNGEQILQCYTEEEKNEKVRTEEIPEENFQKVTSLEELQNCINIGSESIAKRSRNDNYFHPSLRANTQPVYYHLINYAKENIFLNIDDVMIRPNIKICPETGKSYYGIAFQDSFESRITTLDREKVNIFILSVCDNFYGVYHHFTVVVEFEKSFPDNRYTIIKNMYVLDTANTPINQTAFINTINVIVGGVLPENFNNIYYMFGRSNFEKKICEGLQDSEDKMEIQGYCSAWGFYFTYIYLLFSDLNIDLETFFSGIYNFLYRIRKKQKFTLNSIIIYFWDSISMLSLQDISAENWIEEEPGLEQILPSFYDLIQSNSFDDSSDEEENKGKRRRHDSFSSSSDDSSDESSDDEENEGKRSRYYSSDDEEDEVKRLRYYSSDED